MYVSEIVQISYCLNFKQKKKNVKNHCNREPSPKPTVPFAPPFDIWHRKIEKK